MAETVQVSADQMRRTADDFFAALGKLDAAAAAACFAENARVEDPKGGDVVAGRAGIEETYAGMAGMMSRLDVRTEQFYASGDGAAVVWTAGYTGKNGKSGEIAGVDVYEFDPDGRFTSLVGYWDPSRMMADVSG